MKKAAWIIALLVSIAGATIVILNIKNAYNSPDYQQTLIVNLLLVLVSVMVVYVFAKSIERITEK